MGKIVNTENEISEVKQLLDKRLPSYRKAYSDRTAWLMACMSELAYYKFNEAMEDGLFAQKIEKLINSKKLSSMVVDYINKHMYDHEEEKKALVEQLGLLSFRLVRTFSIGGTEAILVKSHSESFLVLAFRGAEATSFTDIKTDLSAQLKICESGGMAHTGFLGAYDEVAHAIKEKIDEDEYKNMPLYITGHSLGGALATIAAKRLEHEGGIAACYTFGSPLVGNDDWIANIKSPIYRIVNAADAVTILPPATGFWVGLKYILDCIEFIPAVGVFMRKRFSGYSGYIHCGDMRYLTHCKNGFKELKLLYHVGIFKRLYRMLFKSITCKRFLLDHSIDVYRNKLFVIARQKNNIA